MSRDEAVAKIMSIGGFEDAAQIPEALILEWMQARVEMITSHK